MTAPFRARRALPLLLVVAALIVPFAPPAAAAGSCEPQEGWAEMRTAWASEVLALTNEHRASLGLGRLAPSASLTSAATWKAAHMARYEYMAHDDPAPPVGRTWDQRIRDCGYSSGAGENIAYGYRTPDDVFQGWLGSAGHRRNIENPSYKVIGIGAAVNGGGTPYWAQVFGLRVESGDGVQVPAPTPPPPDPAVQLPPPGGGSGLAPVARDDVVTVAEDRSVRVAPLGNDTGATAIVATGEPAHGTVRLEGDEVVYVPDPDFNGRDSFTYSTVDASQVVSGGTVTVEVEPRNDAPVAGGDEARTRPRRSVVVPVLENDSDVDGDRLRIGGLVRAPYYGSATVDADTGAVVYRARRGTAGRYDRMTYEVVDGNGGVALATVRVRIAR
ncbi:MAG: Ig-like domain-containing protein [Actinomycetota bacterium]|nr:Ig-like domain-containing protein [Actinomycetota bacterium]